MTGTFRLTGAEFKKIFKRPSVFVMALILVATIFVSLYIYKPVTATNSTVDYKLSTSSEYYNTFYNQDMANTEKGINLVFEETDNLIFYHKNNSIRAVNLQLYYNEINKSFDDLCNASFDDKPAKYTIFKTSLEHFITSFDTSFDEMKDFEHIKFISDNEYYTSTIDTFRKLYNKAGSTDPNSAIDIIKVNKYFETLNKEYYNAVNYTIPVLSGMANAFKQNYYDFDKFIQTEHSELSAIESKRKKLLSNIEEYKKFFDMLNSSPFPIVTQEKDVHAEITDALEYTIGILNKLTTQGKLSDYTDILNQIKNSNVVSFLVDISTNEYIKLVTISKTQATDLEKAQKKVNDNAVAIKNNIESHKNLEGISKIQFDITEYKLLSTTYNQYVNDLLITNIANNFKYKEFIKLYGYDFADYNEYKLNERIAINRYYLEHNKYSNSYISNFSFGQNSSTETNVFDFMYFALELCAIVITVFAMMQICNLITSETESGTMTLLLVRPYKRSKILTAKLLTTIFFVLTFMLFSTVLTFAGGMALFGFESTPILAVLNGSTTFTISPILLMLLNILSLTIDIIFFVLIALLIATVLKNYAGSITACLITIILHYVLNTLFGHAFWYSFFPGINLHLFKFFGNNFVGGDTITGLVTIFNTPIQSAMNIIYSALFIVGYSIISLIISYSVFNSRDY